MQFYLGPAGALQPLPVIEASEQVEATRDPVAAITTSLAGGRTRDVLGRSRGRWVLPWVQLTPGQLAVLSALRAGRLGTPLRLVDPERPNLIHPNLATGGSEEQSSAGWPVTAPGYTTWAAITDPPAGVTALGALSWSRPTTAAGDLTPGRLGHPYRVPALLGQSVRLSLWVRATSGVLTAALGADDFDSAGAVTTTVPAAATVPSSWTELTYTWTPTAGRVSVAPVLRIPSGQPTSTVQLTGSQAVYGTAAQPWSEGGGAPVVLVDSLTEQRPWAGAVDATLTLIEA